MNEHEDSARVSLALRSSVLLGPIDRAIDALWRSAAQSRTMSAITASLEPWLVLTEGQRRSAIALLLGSAAVAAVALTWFYQRPAGWLWLLPPLMAASIGLLLMRSSK